MVVVEVVKTYEDIPNSTSAIPSFHKREVPTRRKFYVKFSGGTS
jgi:hypothetical protein